MPTAYDYRKREIATRELLLGALRKWRLILLVSLLIGGAALILKVRNGQAKESVETLSDAYVAELNAYEEDRESYTRLIERTDALLKEKRSYAAASLLTRIDPAAVGKASATLLIRVPQEEDSSLTVRQLVDAYAAWFTYGADLTEIAGELDTDSAYIAELISTVPSVSSPAAYSQDTAAASPSSGRESLTVTVLHPEADRALFILEALLAQLPARTAALRETLGAHEVLLAGKSSGTYADASVGSRAGNLLQELYTLNTNEERLEAQLAKLKRPALSVGLSRTALRKKALRNGLIGFAGSFFLLTLAIMALTALKGCVLSADEMNGIFRLRRIGLIPDDSLPKNPVDRLLAKLDAEQKNGVEASLRYALAAEAILHAVGGDSRPVVLTGSLDSKALGQTADALRTAFKAQKKGTSLPEILALEHPAGSPDALHQLQEAAGIVLVERIGQSRYPAIAEELQLLEASGVRVLGSIVL